MTDRFPAALLPFLQRCDVYVVALNGVLMCVCGQAYLINVVWKCYKYLVSTLAGVTPTVARCQSDVEHGQLLSPSSSQPSSIQTVTATLDRSSSAARDAQVSISILCLRYSIVVSTLLTRDFLMIKLGVLVVSAHLTLLIIKVSLLNTDLA